MSGSSYGLVFGIVGLPLLLAGWGTVQAVKAGQRIAAKAREERERRQKEEKERLRKLSSNVDSLSKRLYQVAEEQYRRSSETFDRVMDAIDSNRDDLIKTLNADSDLAMDSLTREMRANCAKNMELIRKSQESFEVGYRDKITAAVKAASEEIDAGFKRNMSIIETLKMDSSERTETARKVASENIEQAKAVVDALRNVFNGETYTPDKLRSICNQLNTAIDQYNNKRFEAAAAAAKAVAADAFATSLEADLKRSTHDAAYEHALVLSAELKAFFETHKVISSEFKETVEQQSGRELDDDIVGVSISEYTGDKDKDGHTPYDRLSIQINDIYSRLRDCDPHNIPAYVLETLVESMNTELYPKAHDCISNGLICLNNAFARRRMGEELIDMFEEHGFSCAGYIYDSAGEPLHVVMKHEVSGEELIFTLSPQDINGDLQTRLGIEVIGGDGGDEVRKEEYRQIAQECLNASGSKVEGLQCDKKTYGRLSSNTSVKERLETQR